MKIFISKIILLSAFVMLATLTIMFAAEANAKEKILATNVGIVSKDGNETQVECHLIGSGPLRYPPKAKKFRYVGQVIVKFAIDTSGRVVDPYVVASEPPGVFERAALTHVKSWKYIPPTIDGVETLVNEVAVKLVFDPRRKR